MSANGKLGSALLPSGDAPQMLWQNNTGAVVTLNVRFCNQASTNDAVSVAISPGASNSPAAADYISRQHPLFGFRNYEDGGVRVDLGEKIFVSSLNGNTSVRAWGA